MGLTFDEAIDKIDVNGTLIDTSGILQALQQEYAPTVEMTKEQARVLNEYREPDLYDGDYAFYVFFGDTHAYRLGLRDSTLYDNLTEAQLMQAWLHPDDIQIIDKE